MRGNWREWARGSGWELDQGGFWIRLGVRRQRVMVIEGESGSRLLRSRVARRAILNRVSEPELRAWQRNRVSELVAFRVDRQGVMVAETPIPSDVTRDEWAFLAVNLARSADRFEYLLSGRDEE
jgi:hypothetical protein